jgi:putative endonuclease
MVSRYAQNKPWFVYILLCGQKTFYIGIAENVDERFHEHIRGYSPYTKKFSNFELVYQEEHPSRLMAEKRESQLKGWSVAKKKALVMGDKIRLRKLSKGSGVGDLDDR